MSTAKKTKRAKKPQKLEYTLPAYWASALINGDFSGCDDQEEQNIKKFLETEKPGSCVSCSDESYFAWSNDFDNIGADVLDYIFLKY